MSGRCKCCKIPISSGNDLRFGYCFDCAESESIIVEGKDMYDKDIETREGLSSSMSKLQAILEKYIKIERG